MCILFGRSEAAGGWQTGSRQSARYVAAVVAGDVYVARVLPRNDQVFKRTVGRVNSPYRGVGPFGDSFRIFTLERRFFHAFAVLQHFLLYFFVLGIQHFRENKGKHSAFEQLKGFWVRNSKK